MCEVESVVRGLEVLRLANQRPGMTLGQLAARADLSRGTTYRMLFTLEAANLVERRDDGYYPAHRVRSLSHGFDDDWAADVARPVLRALASELLWPLTVSEPLGGAAVVRETTDQQSPFVFHATRVGFQMSMLATASGRVMIAFASEHQQRALLEQHAALRASGDDQGDVTAADVLARVATIRERGYDLLPAPQSRQTAIAVPVLNEAGDAVAALALRYFNAAMPHTEAVRRFLDPLRRNADRIWRGIRSRQAAAA